MSELNLPLQRTNMKVQKDPYQVNEELRAEMHRMECQFEKTEAVANQKIE